MTWQQQHGAKREACLSLAVTKTHPAAPGCKPPPAETAGRISGKISLHPFFFCQCEEVERKVFYYQTNKK